jgi:regulator of replication initiation timing
MTESKYGSVHKDGSRSGGQPIADTDVQVTPDFYEAFCDVAYFDMWCVRRKGERTFGQGFYVLNEASALELKGELETLATATAKLEADNAALRAENEALRELLEDIRPYVLFATESSIHPNSDPKSDYAQMVVAERSLARIDALTNKEPTP